MLKIWPIEYEKKEHISKEERDILRTAAKHLKEGHIVTGIDPHGLCTPEQRMGMYITPKEGLVTYTIFKGPIVPEIIDNYIMIAQFAEEQIYTRLLDSKLLIVRNNEHKILKFPYKHILIFHGEDLKVSKCSREQLSKLAPYAVSKFFRPLDATEKLRTISDLKIFSIIRKQYNKSFKEISEEEVKAIFERLAPEYTIVMPEKMNKNVKETIDYISDDSLRITGKETEFRTFWLDDYQVGLVNEMGKGHRVILANPGAGKSVILLSKAFKYASLCKDSKVLLTCYNANLADSYRFKSSCADFGDNNNLYIMTLHALVNRIYKDILKMPYSNQIPTQEDIKQCIEYIDNGTIKLRFKSIFIDEVQIFAPLYLDFCYALLENSDDSIFLMAGDLNQSVRNQSRRGDAPWKKMNNVNLDFTGRVKYIEKNYRNSKQIGDYLNRMLCYMNKQMESMNMISLKEFEYNVFDSGSKEGTALVVKSGISRSDITKKVIESLDEITEKYKISYSDVAILYPVKQNRAIKYYFQYWLKQELDNRGIKYSLISSSDDPNERVQYSKASGVVISSIESSLGLDFKAVILAGLYPYNYVFTDGVRTSIKTWNGIKKLSAEQKDDVKKEMRELYTACSRAREVLYILSDLDTGSALEDIILSGGSNNDK